MLGATGIAAVNIVGTIIHSGLRIKPGIKQLCLNDKSKAALRNRLSEVKFLIIDELSMVSSDLWTDIDWRLREIFVMIPKKKFAGLSVMTVADLLQLLPIRGKLIFSQLSDKDRMKQFLGLQLWHLFRYAELTEVLRQNDKLFVNLLNRVRVGNIDGDVENLLKAKFIHESDENYPKDVMHMYAENEPAMKRNDAVLNDLPYKLYTKDPHEKIPDNCKYPFATIQATHNQKQTNTRGLAKLLKLKIGDKVMLTINLNIQNRLINDQRGKISYTEYAQGIVQKVYVKFSDEQTGLKTMRSSYLGRQNYWVPIEKCEAEIPIKKGSASLPIKRTQFSLTLAWPSTIHKVQGLNLGQGVIEFDLRKQKSFGPGQIYTALSRVKTYDNLYCIGEFKKSAVKVNKKALPEYERLKQNDLFSTIKSNNISDKTITVFVQNAQSLSKHINDIGSDDRIINNDIIGFTETQINPSDSNCKMIETLNFFNTSFNNDENKFLSLAYGCRNNVAILDKFNANGVLSLVSRNMLLLTEHSL